MILQSRFTIPMERDRLLTFREWLPLRNEDALRVSETAGIELRFWIDKSCLDHVGDIDLDASQLREPLCRKNLRSYHWHYGFGPARGRNSEVGFREKLAKGLYKLNIRHCPDRGVSIYGCQNLPDGHLPL